MPLLNELLAKENVAIKHKLDQGFSKDASQKKCGKLDSILNEDSVK